MKRDNQPWRALQTATLAWSPEGEPQSATFNDVYFSRENGIAESTHVFLAGNDLPARWKNCPEPHFCVGETGFGTGLNFLLTWQAWRHLPEPRPALHYLSIEQYPLSRPDLERALALWPELEDLAAQLLAAYPGALPGQHRLVLEDGKVRLDLWWEEASDALLDLASRQQPHVDAWFLDGFAPDRNEKMWSPAVLNAVAALSHPDATLATFTVAGAVRRGLAEAGFSVSKVPGFGRKRECLKAVLSKVAVTTADAGHHLRWDLPASVVTRPDSALVVGGGLAGCATAAALARRGIPVTLLEQGEVASAGSGMDQGVIYTRLSRKHSSLVDFALQAFQFATCFYRDLFDTGRLQAGRDGELCGSFQQTSNQLDLQDLPDAISGLEDLAEVLDAAQASRRLGIEQPRGGFWFPRSGWLHPTALCRALLDHPLITVREDCGKVSLNYVKGQWQAVASGVICASAPCTIVAAGINSQALASFDWLPLQTVRGQVTHLPTTSQLEKLRSALCHDGYIAPARDGFHCIGATFEPGGTDPVERADDHRHNLDMLGAGLPGCARELGALDSSALTGRVGFRCASPDYLPVVGPAPVLEAFMADFAGLRRNARQDIGTPGEYFPGLYLNSGHGSRGLTSTPLAAELLASLICGEPPPLSRSLCRALAPARFIIRDLIRNRI